MSLMGGGGTDLDRAAGRGRSLTADLSEALLMVLHSEGEEDALAGVASWIEQWSANQRVTSLIPSQGTCLGCGPGPQ